MLLHFREKAGFLPAGRWEFNAVVVVASITMLTLFQRGKVIKIDGNGNWVNLGALSVACITSLYNCTDGGTLMV